MSSILLVHTWPGANDAVKRHWPYYCAAEADELVGILTTGGGCFWPEGMQSVEIGKNCYLECAHLPNRLMDTLEFGLTTEHEFICVSEYDTVFFDRIPFERMEHAVAAHRAGGKTFGSLAESYWHNPWIFRREAARKFIDVGRLAVERGVCNNSVEASPDVFFGYVTEEAHLPVQDNLWLGFSRNSLDCAGDLDRARDAVKAGVTVVHGVKRDFELERILS